VQARLSLVYDFVRVQHSSRIQAPSIEVVKETAVQMNPYLNFNGECEAAFTLYEKCLGGKIVMSMTYAGSPMASHVPADWGKKILHVSMLIGDQRLQGADTLPDR
jgi:hypothetical protein